MKRKILALAMSFSLAACMLSGCAEIGVTSIVPDEDETEEIAVAEEETEPDAGDSKEDADGYVADASGSRGNYNVKITLANFCADGEPGQNASLFFAEKVREYSEGTIEVEVHNNSEFGNAPEMAQLVKEGSIEACLVCEATLDQYDIRYALVPMPYLYDDYEHAYAVVDGPFREWVNDGTLEKQGLHDIGSWDYGFRNVTNSKHPIEHPSDIEGLTIRTPFEIQLIYTFEALGATVKQISFSELITAMQSGEMDGQENPISTIANNKLWDCNQKYVTMTRHQWESLNLIFNNDFWQGLTPSQREAIEKASKDASASMRSEVIATERDYIQVCKDNGMEVIEDIDKEEFREAVSSAYDSMAEYVGDKALVEKMLEITESVREQQ